MGELVLHYLRELSFDGDVGDFRDSVSLPSAYRSSGGRVRIPPRTLISHTYHRLGCNVSRLRGFISGLYTSQGDHSQLVDDALCAFVWSLVVQQPSVRVGTLPPGSISEVYFAPQTSAKLKAAAKGEEVIEGVPLPGARRLQRLVAPKV